MDILVSEDEISPGVTQAYRLYQTKQGFALRIDLKPEGFITFHFRSISDARSFANRIQLAVQ